MPRWQHFSYSVVVTEVMEKVHPGGLDSWLQTFCEHTALSFCPTLSLFLTLSLHLFIIRLGHLPKLDTRVGILLRPDAYLALQFV